MVCDIDNEMYQLRMDSAALPGEVILNRAIHESRGLTSTEDAGVRFAEMERDHHWQALISEAKKARRHVPAYDVDHAFGRSTKPVGLRLQNTSGTPKLYLYGDIGDGNITAEYFREQLTLVPETSPLELHVFSYGGDLHDSIAIHTLIADRQGEVHGIVDSVAASGGSVLLMACDTITMSRGSWLMLHGVSVEMRGSRTADEIQTAANVARKSNDQLFSIYRPRWKKSDGALEAALSTDSWFDERDAVEVGLADRVSEELAVAANISSKNFRYKNTPATLEISASCHADRIQLRRRLAELQLHRLCSY